MILTQGKRKRAIARASIKKGTGKIKVNNVDLGILPRITKMRISEPILLAGDLPSKYDIDVSVIGGGQNGQSDAARLAIAKGLVEIEPELKKKFTAYDRLLLVADVRRKEVCKPNDSKARAKRQKSYR